jgi:chromosome segregation ATPase
VPKDDEPTKKVGSYSHTEVAAPTPPASPPPAVPPPATATSRSDKLKDDLAKAQADLDKQAKSNASLKADVGVLEKTEKDVEQAISAYQQAWQNLLNDQKDLNEYVTGKLRMAEAAVGKDKAAAIDEIIRQAGTENLESDIAKSRTAVRQAKRNYSNASDELEDAQAEFARAKAYLADQTANLKTAKELMTRTEKEDPAHPENMYFFITEMQSLLQKTDLKPVKNLRNDLSQALQGLDKALSAARAAKDEWEGKQIDFENSQKTLLDSQVKRLDRILSGISALNSVAVPAAHP